MNQRGSCSTRRRGRRKYAGEGLKARTTTKRRSEHGEQVNPVIPTNRATVAQKTKGRHCSASFFLFLKSFPPFMAFFFVLKMPKALIRTSAVANRANNAVRLGGEADGSMSVKGLKPERRRSGAVSMANKPIQSSRPNRATVAFCTTVSSRATVAKTKGRHCLASFFVKKKRFFSRTSFDRTYFTLQARQYIACLTGFPRYRHIPCGRLVKFSTFPEYSF